MNRKLSHLIAMLWVGGLAGDGAALAGTPGVTELFFSEYIEGMSNNKALEIFNGTGAPINLATEGYSVQMFFNGSTTAGLTINLVGTVADGDVFVLAQSSANATILAQVDQTNGAGWFNGDDAVVLRRGATIIDVIGQIGFDPGTEWGAGLASTADNTLRRKPTVLASDANAGDAFDPGAEWDGFAFHSKGGPQFSGDPNDAGDDPLYGAFQPPGRWTEGLRHQQAVLARFAFQSSRRGLRVRLLQAQTRAARATRGVADHRDSLYRRVSAPCHVVTATSARSGRLSRYVTTCG